MKRNDPKSFYKVSIAVDVVIFTVEEGALKVLTITRSDEPFKGTKSLPGGFVRTGEDSQRTAARILKEKAGLEDIYIEQLYTFDDPKRDPRGPVISVAYFALVPLSALSMHISDSTQKPSLTAVKSLGRLAFDHKSIIEYAEERLRGKLEYTNLAFSLLPEKFTFTALQGVYEAIFGKQFDKRNFRKKIARLDLVKPTTERVKQGRQRPALLHRAATKKTQTFKNNF